MKLDQRLTGIFPTTEIPTHRADTTIARIGPRACQAQVCLACRQGWACLCHQLS